MAGFGRSSFWPAFSAAVFLLISGAVFFAVNGVFNSSSDKTYIVDDADRRTPVTPLAQFLYLNDRAIREDKILTNSGDKSDPQPTLLTGSVPVSTKVFAVQ